MQKQRIPLFDTYKNLVSQLNTTHITDWTSYSCYLKTPLFGGGVKPRVTDKGLPFRATAIRGQLRKWWRYANESRFKCEVKKTIDLQKLFNAERALWGGIGSEDKVSKSKVIIQIHGNELTDNRWTIIEGRQQNTIKKQIILEQDASILIYRQANQQAEPDFIIKWSIQNGTKDEIFQVKQAFRLWASFGGVGSRRRRGLGCLEVFEKINNAESQLFINSQDVEALNLNFFENNNDFDNYANAVEHGLKILNDFRQSVSFARGNGNGTRPGGSLWPEANAIRKLTHRSRPQNQNAAQNSLAFFPRAFFGLPIVFQFKADEINGDPFTTMLVPMSQDGQNVLDRFASPFIFGARKIEIGYRFIYRPICLLLPTHNNLRTRNLHISMGDNFRTDVVNWWPKTNDPITIENNIEIRRNSLPHKLSEFFSKNGDLVFTFKNFFVNHE